MVSFKFCTSKTVNFATEASEKGNFHAGPIAACCKGKRHIHINIKILYGAKDLRINGFTPKNVSQVITGAKKSHAGYIFLDFFKLPKEEKEKYINLIDITTKI